MKAYSVIGLKKPAVFKFEEFLRTIAQFASENDLRIAAADADFVLGQAHAVSSVKHAVLAFERKKNISDRLETEILLYLSGERQIAKAIARVGLRRGTDKIALIIVGRCPVRKLLSTLSARQDNSVLGGSPEKLKKFDFSDIELGSVTCPEDLILERIALLEGK